MPEDTPGLDIVVVIPVVAPKADLFGEVEEDEDGDRDVDEMESGEGVVEGEEGILTEDMTLLDFSGVFDHLYGEESQSGGNRGGNPAQGLLPHPFSQFGEAADHEPAPSEEDSRIE